MGMMAGKQGVIMGVANEFSLAAAVARKVHGEGAKLTLSHLPDKDGGPPKNARRVSRFAEDFPETHVAPCDVGLDQDITGFFRTVAETREAIDFLVHSIAFAPWEDISGMTVDVSRRGFQVAMDISVYSFLAVAREAAQLMPKGGAILTMTYFGGEKVVEGYNLMGLCKAALDAAVRYLAAELGPRGIRVNAISASPIKTLASSAMGDFAAAEDLCARYSPMRRNASAEDVAKAATFLLSDWSAGTSGEIFHVDGGYHVMGGSPRVRIQP